VKKAYTSSVTKTNQEGF